MSRLWDDEGDAFWDSDSAVWDEEEETPPMNNARRLYKCTDALLHSEAGLIIGACDADAAVKGRLPAGAVPTAQQLLQNAIAATAGQQNNATELEALTSGQNAALTTIKLKSTLARDTAKIAFRGQTTKLREQFGLGEQPQQLAAITALALRIHAGCVDTDNAAALAAKGWLATDSAALETAILALTGADSLQEARKAVNKGGTIDYIGLNNALYDTATTMQNACAIEHPTQSSADIAARQTFRIGIFPPARPKGLPTIPRKVTAKFLDGLPLRLYINWNIATRAIDYLGAITNKATGEVIATFQTADNKHTLELPALPSGTALQITLQSRNESGTSKPSNPVTATVP